MMNEFKIKFQNISFRIGQRNETSGKRWLLSLSKENVPCSLKCSFIFYPPLFLRFARVIYNLTYLNLTKNMRASSWFVIKYIKSFVWLNILN